MGQLGSLKIMASGGITPANVFAWLDCGAKVVGMGSKLVGREVRISPNDSKNLIAAREEWLRSGYDEAAKLFASIK